MIINKVSFCQFLDLLIEAIEENKLHREFTKAAYLRFTQTILKNNGNERMAASLCFDTLNNL